MSRTFALLIIAAATITAAGIATFAAVRDSVVDGDSSGADDGLFFIDADRPPANGEKSLELANQPISVDIPAVSYTHLTLPCWPIRSRWTTRRR